MFNRRSFLGKAGVAIGAFAGFLAPQKLFAFRRFRRVASCCDGPTRGDVNVYFPGNLVSNTLKGGGFFVAWGNKANDGVTITGVSCSVGGNLATVTQLAAPAGIPRSWAYRFDNVAFGTATLTINYTAGGEAASIAIQFTMAAP